MRNSLTVRVERGKKTNAGERLKTLLAHDRAGISPAILDVLKEEIIAAISRHVDTRREAVEIGLDQGAQESRLIVTIPLRSINTRRKR